MKFNKMMTKVLSALIMVSMVGTSVQVPTLAEVTNAGRAIVAGTVEDKAKDASGSTESKDAGAADDEDNKNQNDAENAENNEQAAASDSNAQNNTENSSKGGANTSSVSGAKNNSSSSSSYNNISSSNTSNNSTSTSQVLEPFSKDNDSDKLSFDKDFSLFSYFGQTQTFSAIAANGDGSDIEWQVEPKFFSISTPKVDGAKSTVDITWDKETVEDIERAPFYAMLKSNPYEKITGTIYLSNGQAPSEEEQQQDAGSKKEFESEEVKNFVEDMYKTGLTQENSVYDLSLLGDTNNNTGATDFSNMSDEEILKAFEEKQNSENADNKDNTETLSDTKTETTENPTNADVYTIKITLDNDKVYSIGNDYDNKLTISPQSGHFTTDESWVYDGKTHKPNMTVDAPYDESKYTITYRKQGTETDLTEITDAGVYDIIITFPNGNYIADETSSKTITVTPKTVNFTVTDNVVDYDGNEHTAKVTPTEALASDLYSVKYVKRDTETKFNSVINAGVYDIVIELANSNYTLDNSFSATMTVNVTYTFNLGNSPAAMIYKDTTHDAEWQKEALDYLKANHKFSENYLPKDCSADITYNPINNIDADGNEYTVITSGLDKFVDPGVNINDGSTSDTIKGTVSAVSGVEGLYKVTYQINDSTMERYLLVVDRRIGDVNSDGAVNGIDANNLVGKDADANGVKQARIWDVNKDGRIDNNDVNAIRNRFSVRLEAYYPWL